MNGLGIMFVAMAYRSNQSIYCLGNCVERFDSDFQWLASPDEDEIINFLARWADYETTLLCNGEESPDDDAVRECRDRMLERVKFRADILKEEKQKDHVKKVAEERQRNAEIKEKQEREELARLLKKFEVKQP